MKDNRLHNDCDGGHCVACSSDERAERWTIGDHGKAIGKNNREKVRAFMASHIGATNGECSKEIGLSEMAVGRHIKSIRAEWDKPKKPDLHQPPTDIPPRANRNV